MRLFRSECFCRLTVLPLSCFVFCGDSRSGRTLGASVLNYVRTGAMHDVTFFQKRLRAILGDITFQDAYDRSGGRMLCVAVCATREGERPRLLNYLTAPHLIVWSAVAASCAFPGLFAPQPLLAKSRCGSLVPWQARLQSPSACAPASVNHWPAAGSGGTLY